MHSLRYRNIHTQHHQKQQIKSHPLEDNLHVASYKESMSRTANQAMILTSAFKAKGPGGLSASAETLDDLHGMTLSSVVSLSVQPRTLIQFNLQVPSSTSAKLHDLRWFAIHLLPPVKGSVELVKTFSKGSKYLSKNHHADNKNSDFGKLSTKPFIDLKPEQFIFSSQVYSTKNILVSSPYYSISDERRNTTSMELSKEKLDIPLLSSAERILICSKDRVFKVDDHELWIGEVRDILIHTDFHQNTKSGGLLFFNRSFHKLGACLSDTE
ncbi:hypothetical protein DASC09_028680 [Saccharomycopsis crataegensis]|uniref:Flavin reductase like domain-containing protein n=1 Tax=Saccharomycopsis crataegensis TaxID=43959 RepID=A0AAV5QL82_9ASCO|nr:hypothetical protein DASC09_028680 [Saccharomycopsis crataegensis]